MQIADSSLRRRQLCIIRMGSRKECFTVSIALNRARYFSKYILGAVQICIYITYYIVYGQVDNVRVRTYIITANYSPRVDR